MNVGEQRAVIRTDWGRIELTASETGVTSVVLKSGGRVGDWCRGTAASDTKKNGAFRTLEEAQAQLREYLAGARRDFSVPIDLSNGTAFQRSVWQAIRRIPYGRVRSYQWVAAKVGGKQYARAVGMALGANPIPIIVPCHRIVAHDGSLGGFGCGLPMKRRLLKLEGTLGQLS
jgi:methylated-DNA-[protein]-cysteine S-methyltransferase